jgi:APA family basic amino acid/polyamine antiporter
MTVMGGIIGSGIFINPYVVAKQVHSPVLILGAWLLGGFTALAGAFVYAELAELKPRVGGQYAYMREAYHPSVAFVYGWTLLLVTQTGGMAAVAITFARYCLELTHVGMSDWLLAALSLGILTIINCLGVRAGSTVQNILMMLKIAAIAGLILTGFAIIHPANLSPTPVFDRPVSTDLFTAFAVAMVPVLFAFGGWQTTSFIAGEIKDAQKTLPRGILLGVLGVITIYMLVNIVCLGVLGADGLANTSTPASAIMRLGLGQTGATIIALGITISTLGFLSQGILTAPRVYYAMAKDGVFFKQVAWVHPKTHVPVVAIAVQGVLAVIIAATGKYEQILNYVISCDFIFMGLTATTIFVFRKRFSDLSALKYKTPGHPYTTFFFIAVCWIVVGNLVYSDPADAGIGWAIMLTGIPVYFLWNNKRKKELA